MGSEAKKLLEQALQLSDADRARLAASLIDSLEPAANASVEAAWDQEIARRAAELDSGAVQPVAWSEARRRILAGR